jgi:histidinol-phosphate aminotransferase
MSRFWSDVVKGLTPYVPGEQPKLANLVKLNTNENPYGPSPRALEAIRAATDDTLKLYPDPNADALKRAIAAAHGLEATAGLRRQRLGRGARPRLPRPAQA